MRIHAIHTGFNSITGPKGHFQEPPPKVCGTHIFTALFLCELPKLCFLDLVKVHVFSKETMRNDNGGPKSQSFLVGPLEPVPRNPDSWSKHNLKQQF